MSKVLVLVITWASYDNLKAMLYIPKIPFLCQDPGPWPHPPLWPSSSPYLIRTANYRKDSKKIKIKRFVLDPFMPTAIQSDSAASNCMYWQIASHDAEFNSDQVSSKWCHNNRLPPYRIMKLINRSTMRPERGEKERWFHYLFKPHASR